MTKTQRMWLREYKVGQCPPVGRPLDVEIANKYRSLAFPQICCVLRQVALIGLFPFIISFKNFFLFCFCLRKGKRLGRGKDNTFRIGIEKKLPKQARGKGHTAAHCKMFGHGH